MHPSRKTNKEKPQQFGKNQDIHEEAKCVLLNRFQDGNSFDLSPREAIDLLEGKIINKMQLTMRIIE